MSFYDVVKDALSIAQKADNGDLIKQLLDIGQQALELQNENLELKKRIQELEADRAYEDDMEFQIEPYYTLKSDPENRKRYFCSTCWGREKKRIQMWFDGERKVHCPSCEAGFSITPCKHKQMISY